jgi:hypothetical protein
MHGTRKYMYEVHGFPCVTENNKQEPRSGANHTRTFSLSVRSCFLFYEFYELKKKSKHSHVSGDLSSFPWLLCQSIIRSLH